MGCQHVHPRAAGIAQAEQLGNFVEGFAGGVVYRATHVAIAPHIVGLLGQIQMGVAAADHEGKQRHLQHSLLLPGLHQHRVDVPLEVIDGDQRLVEAERQGLGVGDSYEQRAGQPGSFGHGDRVQIGELDARLAQRGPHDRHNVLQVFAGRQLRHDASVVGVERDLRGDHVGEHLAAAAYNGRRGLVAGAFDAEDESAFLDLLVRHFFHDREDRVRAVRWCLLALDLVAVLLEHLQHGVRTGEVGRAYCDEYCACVRRL